MNKHRTVANMALTNCLGCLNIDTDDMDPENDIEGCDIDIGKDFEGSVADCLNGFFYNHEGFRYNSSQCNNLCHAFIAKLSKYFANNGDILSPTKEIPFTRNAKCVDVSKSCQRGKKVLQRAWKEMYRVVKEAQIYLQDCSNAEKWWMKAITSSIGGAAHVVHTHDLLWSLICLDLNYSYSRAETEQSYTKTACRNISDFHAEMSNLSPIHDENNNILILKALEMEISNLTRIDDECHNIFILKAREMEISNLTQIHDEYHNIFLHKACQMAGIAKFLSAKLQATIRGEPAVIDSRVCSWLQIDSKDLIPRQRLIGSGTFGKVYEGSWLGVKVAVKEIPLFAGDMDYLAPEIAAHAKLQSPFVVQLIGICSTETYCYFVMELVSSSLEKILEDRSKGNKPPLALPVAVDMMLQISMGMEYLHRQKIMHMDLKSSNVLIQPSALPEFRDHGYGRVKICDFGDASLRLCSFRYPEDTKGTCKWRAPEVFSLTQQENLEIEINAPKEYTYKADVYSFAMTCYEILTGKHPFEDVLLEKTIYSMVVRGQRPSLPPFCPSVLADFIKKCWDTDPNRRPCFAEISNFMRLMKMLIMRSEDSSDWDSVSAICRDFDKAQLVKFEYNEEEVSDDRVPNSVEEGLHRCFLQQSAPTSVVVSLPHYIKQYSYEEMQNATDNFSVEVGEVSGLMWKGTLSDGTQVVVKKLYFESSLTKISMMCLMHHPNALHLLGISAGYEACLVFDHMIMGSLAAKLFNPRSILNWTLRKKIGLGIASFLAYLHNDHMTKFLNLRINASNVYLDERFTAKLGGFDSIMPIKVSSQSLSPWDEGGFDQQGVKLALQFEEFRNVQDFGVLLLELLMGCRCETMQYSLQSIHDSIQGEGGYEFIGERLLDTVLEGEVEMGEAMRWVRLALWCLVRSPSHRPNMNTVVLAMKGQFEVSPLPENNMFKNYQLSQREYIRRQEQCSQLSEMWREWENITKVLSRDNLSGSMEMDWHGLAKKNCWTRDDSVAGSAVESSSANPPWFQRLVWSEKTNGSQPSTPTEVEGFFQASEGHDLQVFKFNEIRIITRNFHPDNLVGEGGNWRVFMGYIDDSGRQGFKDMLVAVKVLSREGHRGLKAQRRWLAKVNFLGQLRHPHLVKLMGYCFEDVGSVLVCEFMHGGSLDNYLFSDVSIPLSWCARLKIAVEAAKGLAFLHGAQKPFILRDFKTSNILLDLDCTAKLSDFLLAAAEPPEIEGVFGVVTFKNGYAAPEYVAGEDHLTTEVHVYSFGVVLLELLAGRRSIDENRPREEQELVKWARPYVFDKKKFMRIMDPRLKGQYSLKAAYEAACLAYQCLNRNPKSRPLMKDIVETLEPLQNMTHKTSVTSFT